METRDSSRVVVSCASESLPLDLGSLVLVGLVFFAVFDAVAAFEFCIFTSDGLATATVDLFRTERLGMRWDRLDAAVAVISLPLLL